MPYAWVITTSHCTASLLCEYVYHLLKVMVGTAGRKGGGKKKGDLYIPCENERIQ
jgi:hypothetical protein